MSESGVLSNVFEFPTRHSTVPPRGGGGGGEDSGIALRVAWLEESNRRIEAKLDMKFDAFDERLRRIEEKMAEMKGKLSSLPTTWTMVVAIAASQISLGGILVGVIKAFGTR